MKKLLHKIGLTLALVNASLYAEVDFNKQYYNEDFEESRFNEGERGPFTVETSYDYIGSSKFNKRGFRSEKIWFSDLDIEASAVVYYNKECKEGLSVSLGYNASEIHWSKNIFTDQTFYQNANISIGAGTKRMPNWLWKGQLTYSLDVDHPKFSKYSTWDFLGWGRYTYRDDIGLHMGLIVLTGMKIDHVYPILGADWEINECWKINGVFPVNLSVVYAYNECWSFELAGRGWENRFRTGKHQPLSEGLLVYTNTGLEFGVNYDFRKSIHANIHVGYTTGGKLKVADKNNHHAHHFKFKAAPYAGAELIVNF